MFSRLKSGFLDFIPMPRLETHDSWGRRLDGLWIQKPNMEPCMEQELGLVMFYLLKYVSISTHMIIRPPILAEKIWLQIERMLRVVFQNGCIITFKIYKNHINDARPMLSGLSITVMSLYNKYGNKLLVLPRLLTLSLVLFPDSKPCHCHGISKKEFARIKSRSLAADVSSNTCCSCNSGYYMATWTTAVRSTL